MIVMLMGVSGSRKSTIGKVLAEEARWTFVEADAYHPAANVEKSTTECPSPMRTGARDAPRWVIGSTEPRTQRAGANSLREPNKYLNK
ncbi:hypothetical protein [Gemmata obscuriglobus]|uniref:hypothetical protein n=1 Tax=Gemmata obscuriglobus TaxID=114 RepID=UPI0011CE4B46|nr:hypothetical protein [Gemmata obscuriglobus]